METLTPNYGLRKQDEDEFYTETINSDNMDILDGAIKTIATSTGGNSTDIAAINAQLSDMNINDIESRQEILDIKLKLDELNVVEFINKTGIGFFDLFEDSTNVDLANTTATVGTDVAFVGAKALQMKSQTFDNFTDIELALYDKNRELFDVSVAVNNSATISMNITPGSRTIGEKFFFNGAVYTITNVVQS